MGPSHGARMPRWFNIAGPCFADEHYMIPPERRAVEARELIDQGRWLKRSNRHGSTSTRLG